MTGLTLQDALDSAGSPIRLLWRADGDTWMPYRLPREFAGWRAEQTAWHETVALSDLSFHMTDTYLEGPDATRLLSDYGVNDFENFAIGQAKQYVPVDAEGLIITDGILLRTGANSYVLTGVATSQSWVTHHAGQGSYDVTWSTSANFSFRTDEPEIFRYQVQGPNALALVEKVFGGPLPTTKFFHVADVTLGGRPVKALRHGMAGQPGYEFIGDAAHAAYVKEALLNAGEEFGIRQVGALAYPTAGVESGWVPTPTPAIYTDPALAGYRRSLSAFSYEGKAPHYGSYFSDDIEDYYLSPFELGYGRLISFAHEFLGRDALRAMHGLPHREKVTLVLDADEVRRVIGEIPTEVTDADLRNVYSSPSHRVEVGGELVGRTTNTAFIHPVGTVLALALVEPQHAAPGSQVDVVWGLHPGPGTASDADLGFPSIPATVQPAPYDDFARRRYRVDE
jgi:vanillate/3-O-methylgallate O-demethylase